MGKKKRKKNQQKERKEKVQKGKTDVYTSLAYSKSLFLRKIYKKVTYQLQFIHN